MFIRIVKLSFQEDKVPVFLEHFELIKERVRFSPGCQFLELYRDQEDPTIFFTYSFWNDPQDLENYKRSTTFGEVWPFVKTLFKDKPEAWSVDKLVSIP